MSIAKATNIVLYNGTKPANISVARWNAIVRYITREIQ